MKNLKKKFESVCQSYQILTEKEAADFDFGGPKQQKNGESYIELEYAPDSAKGKIFIVIPDDDFDEFTDEHGLTIWQDKENENRDHPVTIKAIEKACDCKIIWNEQEDRPEVIFNEDKELYLISAGLWDIAPTPRQTRDDYYDYIKDSLDNCPDCLLEKMFEHDDTRLEYDKLKEIADKNHNWQNMLYAHDDWVSGSVWLTEKQAKELKDDFYLESMEALFDKAKKGLVKEN